ncbi:histidine kinase, partial [Romboutsia ilealis]|nr:histidine kinase [Romboutsia ilealis]
LQESISALIESKKLEYRAQRASLQSQISPHFIGNTLTVIGAKGYECGVFAVDEMCVLLSTMMRYITKQSDFCTTIANEVAYTEMYLKLIK